MKAVIVGCGRAGATIADGLEKAGFDVIVIDRSTAAFEKLPGTFHGSAIRGDGTDEDVLRRAGAEDADVFLTLTEGDNRNVMSAQLAIEALGARRVVAKVNDPVRAAAYADLGISTLCRTNLIEDAIMSFLALPSRQRPGVQVARGRHPGGEHHHVDSEPSPGAVGAGGARERAQPAEVVTATRDGGAQPGEFDSRAEPAAPGSPAESEA